MRVEMHWRTRTATTAAIGHRSASSLQQSRGILSIGAREQQERPTHIDQQLRLVLGTLREEGPLDRKVIVFTSGHGDMLGDFGLIAKRPYPGSRSRGESSKEPFEPDDDVVVVVDGA